MASSHTSGSTSTSLVYRARQHDPLAWDRLTRCYGPLVYGWNRRAGLQDSDAADVMQEVFAAVASNLSNFRRDGPGQSFRGWLWTITRNKIRDHFRREAKRPLAGGTNVRLQVEQAAEQEVAPPTGEATDNQLVQMHLLWAIEAEFPPHQWRATELINVRRSCRHGPAVVSAYNGILSG